MKNKAVIFMMSMVLAMGSAVPAHADTEISENKDLAENGQGVSEYANGWVTGDNDTFFYIDGIKLYDAGCEIDGYWYYFDATGAMQKNYWREKNGEWYYYDANGHLVMNQEMDINGRHYKFTENGAIYRGWYTDGTDTYYYETNGSRLEDTGKQIDGYWYYFQKDGKMLYSDWREKDTGYYYYDDQGHLILNAGIQFNGYWYYLDGSGRRYESQFRQKGADWYYYDEEGHLVMDRDLKIGGYRYIFQSNGAAYRGLKTENEKVIGFTPMGRQAFDDSVQDGTDWYYFDASGDMKKDYWRTKAGEKYYYQADGKLARNKGLEIDGIWYYFADSGKMYTGWREKDGNRYYYNSYGYLITNDTVIIDGVNCRFDTSGRLLNDVPAKIAEICTYTWVPYRWGGATTGGWDCSGFTQWAMAQLGVSVPRLAYEQAQGGTWIDPWDISQWKPGDLVCYTEGSGVSHMALYIGNNQIIHALSPKYGTIIHDVDYYEKWDRGTWRVAVKRYL